MTDKTARLIDLVHAARDQGLYEDDPAWGEVDALLRLLRPSKALRGVSLPPDPGGPVGFTCPICGAHEDEPTVSMEAVVVESRPHVQAWPGGPVVEDYGKPPERTVVDRPVSTSTCEHTFSRSEWVIAGHRHETSGRQWVTVTRKTETNEKES